MIWTSYFQNSVLDDAAGGWMEIATMKETQITNTHQIIQSEWERRIFGDARTLEGRLEKFKEEVQEALEPDLTPRKRAEELADVIIVALGTIDTLGFDFDNLYHAKMMTNYTKYSAFLIKAYINQGMTAAEAMQQAKKEWNATLDKPQNG